MNRSRLLGIGAIGITSLLWGTTGTAATFEPAAGPLAIGAAALGIGGLLQAAIAVPALHAARAVLRTQWRLIAIGAAAVAIYPLAFYSSMHVAGVAIGSVASLASAPLAAGVLERIIDRRRLSAGWMIAAALGVLGSVLLCLSKLSGTDTDTAMLPTAGGIALGLVAGLTYATYSWSAHRLMGRGVSRSASMGAIFGCGGALLMPVLLITGGPLLASTGSLVAASYIALLPMFVGYLLFGFGLTCLSPSTATTITLTEPAIATVLAVVIVGEQLGMLGWIGLGIIAVVLLILALAPTNVVHPIASSAQGTARGTRHDVPVPASTSR